MESKTSLRLIFLLLTVVFLFLLTWTHLPSAPNPDVTALLDCAANSPSPWCTRLQINNKHNNNHHASDTPKHPLDPLTIQEINKVRTILSSHTLFKSSISSYAFHSIVLEEPYKEQVLRWKKGDPLLPRVASVVARVSGHSHLLTVNLETTQVTQNDHDLPLSGYPMMTVEDMTSSTWAPLSNAQFNRSITQRGVDLADLACLPISLGWFGKKEEKRRLIKVQCYSMKDTANFYMRPIEGLTWFEDQKRN